MLVPRSWSLGKGAFLGLALLRCAQGENLGFDQAPTHQPPPAMGGTTADGGSGGSAAPSVAGGANGGSTDVALAGGAGSSGSGGSAGSGGSSGASSGSGGSEPAGGAGGGEDSGGDGGQGPGIVGGDPYGGTPWTVPGTIEAENFDLGGAGVAYADTTAENFGNSYRAGDAVDIEACTDTGAGYDVGWNFEGEWRNYTIDVASAGTYTLSARVASPYDGAFVRVEIDGVDVSGALAVPNTAGYQIWQTITKSGIALGRGIHVVRVVIPASTEFNINWLSFG